LFIDLLSSHVNELLKLSERYRIGRLFWPIVSTIGLSGFHIIVLTLIGTSATLAWLKWSRSQWSKFLLLDINQFTTTPRFSKFFKKYEW